MQLHMASIHQEPARSDRIPPNKQGIPSDSGSSSGSDSDDGDDTLRPSSPYDYRLGIDIDAIKSTKKIQHSVTHRIKAERSILALVVDDEYLFAGLEGGNITVCSRPAKTNKPLLKIV